MILQPEYTPHSSLYMQPKILMLELLFIPQEFKISINKMPALKSAFEALAPGIKKRLSDLFFCRKQANTREARIEKYPEQIINRIGLND